MAHAMPADPVNEAEAVSDELKRTPLEAEHLRLGAKMAPFAGWQMPIEYEGALAEHRAVRSHVEFDLTHLGKVEVVGAGALGMLQRLVTNDLSRARVGEALYNLVLNEGGGVIEDLIVYRLGEERYFVVPNASNAPRVLRMLEEEKADEPLHLMYHQDWCFLAVQGPEATNAIAATFPTAPDLAFMRCMETEYHRRPVIVTRSGYTGEVGFELFTYQDVAQQLWDELLGSVRTLEAAPAGSPPATSSGSRWDTRSTARTSSRHRPRSRRASAGPSPWTKGISAGAPRSCDNEMRASEPAARPPDARTSTHPQGALPGVRGRPTGGR